MKNVFILAICSILFMSCGSKKQALNSRVVNPLSNTSNIEPYIDISEYAPDEEYGLVGEKPIKVGDKSPTNQRRYIASLAGPNGEELSFTRRGSCCGYKSENGFGGFAMVDVYAVTYEGLKEPINLYISFYDFETLYIPVGFTKREL